jgi:AcrR family transcriptional regulator
MLLTIRYRTAMDKPVTVSRTVRRPRLRREDWARAALSSLADGGLAAVVVETLAERLGTTKGSFYWHFADREALIAAALELWEREHTMEVIDHLNELPDPAGRLHRLFELAFVGGDVGGAISVALYADAGNHLVAPVLERVSRRRVEFLTEVFTDLGIPKATARHRALAAYTAYVGHFQLQRAAPAVSPTGPDERRYLRHLFALLGSPTPTASR